MSSEVLLNFEGWIFLALKQTFGICLEMLWSRIRMFTQPPSESEW